MLEKKRMRINPGGQLRVMNERENKVVAREYIYLGDKNTDSSLRGRACSAVRRQDGKCIRGKNGSMLVTFGKKKMVVVGRLLRKIKSN
jgi:hypothetical protein